MTPQSTKRPLDGITFEGIPLEPIVQEIEHQEVGEEFNEESGKYRRAIRRSGRVKMKSAVESHGKPRELQDDEVFRILVEKAGKKYLDQYIDLAKDTKLKLARLHKSFRVLPKQFLSSEALPLIKQLGLSDHQRILFMLHQAGYLARERDFGHRIIHVKTDLALSLTDEQMAIDLLAKNAEIVGFPSALRSRTKRTKATLEQAPVLPPVAQPIPVEGLADQRVELPAPAESLFHAIKPETLPEIEAAGDLLAGLDQGDQLMVLDLIRSLKLMRQIMPRLSREDFLQTFSKGSGFVKA